jgi:hypothetical protein
MKPMFIAAAAASILLSSGADAAPFPSNVPQLSYQTYTYNIAAHATFKSFRIPVQDRPIQMMATCTTPDDRGVGSVTLLRSTAGGNFLQWSGSDYAEGATRSFSTNPGIHIMYPDFAELVDVQVNSADTIRIANTSAGPVTVVVTLIY